MGGQLKTHEVKCEERTVKCLNSKCRAEVQLKKFEEHVKETTCWLKLNGSEFIHTVSLGFLKWDGVSKKRGEEFDLDKEEPSTRLYIREADVFIMRKYFPLSRVFVYAVIMAKNPDEVEKYSANITIFNESGLETSFKCPIIPIEQFPSEEELINHEDCWNVHYSLLRKFYYFEDKGKNNNHDWAVKVDYKIE